MSKYTTITAKSAPACVTLQEAAAALRIEGSDLDTEIQFSLDSAVEYVERATHRALRVSYTISETYDNWTCNPIRFDWQPVKSITSVTYYDTSDASQTVDSSNYRLISQTDGASVMEWDDGFSTPSIAVRSDAVTINYTAGYEDIDSVPGLAETAIKLKLKDLFGYMTERESRANEASLKNVISQLSWGQYR
tara:strand:- start:944 stop:1519 length:576 start_codon:yes stop_codon:yes gene_type:complete